MLQQKKYKILTVIMLLILVPPIVLAIGISPGKHTTNFAPNTHDKVDFRVINNERKDMQVAIYAEGDLKDYVKLHDGIINMKPENEQYETYYDVDLPNHIDKPGTHEIRITAVEIAENNKGSGVFLTTAVVSKLFIRVPYPDKYTEIGEILITDAEVGKTAGFIIPITNLGKMNVLHAKATIDILGPTNEKIAAIESDDKQIKTFEKVELLANWNTKNINPGKYYAIINLNYDGNTIKKEKQFEIGSLLVDIIDVNVKDFRLGGIAKFNILVESMWNEKIEGSYATLTITDSNNNKVGDAKSANKNIEALSKAELTAFWDTEGVKEGNYDADLTLYYEGRQKSKKLKTQVTGNAINIDILGTGRAVSEKSQSNKNLTLSILVVILIIINIGWFVYMRKRKQSTNY